MRQTIKASCPDCGEQVDVEVSVDSVRPQRDLLRRVQSVYVTADGTAVHYCPDNRAEMAKAGVEVTGR